MQGEPHLATFGLIHMNGRIYDPLIGRFLQSDPIVQEPYNLQSHNRYSYVMNNPLAYTDPTGYSRWTNHRKQFWAVVAGAILGPGGWFGSGGVFGAGGLNILTGFTAQVSSAAAAGFAAGGIQGGNLNSALQGAVGAVASTLLIPTTGSWLGDVALNAGISCASAKGRSCGDAAANSVYSSLLGSAVGWAGRSARGYFAQGSASNNPYGLSARRTNEHGEYQTDAPKEISDLRTKNPSLVKMEEKSWADSQAQTEKRSFLGFEYNSTVRGPMEHLLLVYRNNQDGSLLYNTDYKATPQRPQEIVLPEHLPQYEGYTLAYTVHTHPFPAVASGMNPKCIFITCAGIGSSDKDFSFARRNNQVYHGIQVLQLGQRDFIYYGRR
jgi:RHS repeat-associated protein